MLKVQNAYNSSSNEPNISIQFWNVHENQIIKELVKFVRIQNLSLWRGSLFFKHPKDHFHAFSEEKQNPSEALGFFYCQLLHISLQSKTFFKQ